MSSDKENNSVKVLFHIANSFVFAFGLAFFASGVGNAAINGCSIPDIIAIVIGILVPLFAVFGHCSAIVESKKGLKSYSTLMWLLAANGIVHLVRTKPAPRGVGHELDKVSDDEAAFTGLIFMTIVTLVTALLGCGLAGVVGTEFDDKYYNKRANKALPNAV